jgi:Transcription factor WhiB
MTALSDALLSLTRRDKRPPCTHDPDRWTSDDRWQRDSAVRSCQSCPLIAPCVDYANQIKATHGVWGGVDYTKATRTPRRATT